MLLNKRHLDVWVICKTCLLYTSTPEKPIRQDEAYIIKTQNLTQWDIQWSDLYGTLPQGEYRIGKEIQDFRGGSDYDEKAYYAEFVIE